MQSSLSVAEGGLKDGVDGIGAASAASAAAAAAFASPKRKREPADVGSSCRSPTRMRIDLPMRPVDRPQEQTMTTPRSKVSGQLKRLDLSAGDSVSFAEAPPSAHQKSRPGPEDDSNMDECSTEDRSSSYSSVITVREERVGEGSPSPRPLVGTQYAEADHQEVAMPGISLEPPATPTLAPAKSPPASPQAISPLPQSGGFPSPPPAEHLLAVPEPPPLSSSFSPPPSPSPSSPLRISLGPEIGSPYGPSSGENDGDGDGGGGGSQSKSPPPPTPPPPPSDALAGSPKSSSPLVWTAAEITGHDPQDPSDDGYGINGIGFRPTPAIAYARAQRRRQQLADWRTREAREARLRRAERRSASSHGAGGAAAGVGGGGVGAQRGAARRRVRFVEP